MAPHKEVIPTRIQSNEGKELLQIRMKLAEKCEFSMFHTHNCEMQASVVECFFQELKKKNGTSYLNSHKTISLH